MGTWATTDAIEEPFSGTWRLTYFDFNGKRSERVVDALGLTKDDGDCQLRAFCHRRQAERTFRATRIASMINDATGQALSELGGVKLVSESARDDGAADLWLQGGGQPAADILMLAARGMPGDDVLTALVQAFPDPYVHRVSTAALRAALQRRTAEQDAPVDDDDAVRQIEWALDLFEMAPEDQRLAMVRLLAQVLQTSPLEQAVCVQLLERAASKLRLKINITRR